MTKSFISNGLSVFVAAMALVGCDGSSSPPVNDQVELQLSWSLSPEHAALLLGKETIFPQYGIDLSLIPSKGSNETLTSAAAGKYSFVIASAESLVLARDQGVPVKSIMQMYRHTPAVVFSIDKIIKEPKDLVDLRVGVIRSSTVTTQLNLMLAVNNIRYSDEPLPSSVQYETAVAGGAAQLEANKIDALTHYWNYAPALYAAKGRNTTAVRFKDYGVNTYSAGLVVSDDTIKNKKDLVQRFVCALIDSYELSLKRPSETLASYLQYQKATTPVDEQYAHISLERTGEMLMEGLDGHRIGYHDVKGWEQTLRTMSDASGTGVGLRDPTYLFDTSFYHNTEKGKCAKLIRHF